MTNNRYLGIPYNITNVAKHIINFKLTYVHRFYLQAKIRYATENEAKVAWDKALEEAKDKKVLFDEKELTGVVIEGWCALPSLKFERIRFLS